MGPGRLQTSLGVACRGCEGRLPSSRRRTSLATGWSKSEGRLPSSRVTNANVPRRRPRRPGGTFAGDGAAGTTAALPSLRSLTFPSRHLTAAEGGQVTRPPRSELEADGLGLRVQVKRRGPSRGRHPDCLNRLSQSVYNMHSTVYDRPPGAPAPTAQSWLDFGSCILCTLLVLDAGLRKAASCPFPKAVLRGDRTAMDCAVTATATTLLPSARRH